MTNQEDGGTSEEEVQAEKENAPGCYSENCDICGEKISARNFALLQMRCQLHMRDHYFADQRQKRDRAGLVWNGSGWRLKSDMRLP